MATIIPPQSFENTIHHTIDDIKEPIVLEVLIDDSPKSSTEIWPTKENFCENDHTAQESNREDGPAGTSTPSITLVAPPSLDIDAPMTSEVNLVATTMHDLSLTLEDNSPSSTPVNSLPSTPDVYPPATPAALNSELDLSICERPFKELALQILDIIQKYGHGNGAGSHVDWAGKEIFLPLVELAVEKKEPVKMVLPAFPFKSNNKVDKVLGTQPDLGEELALMHLNGLCESIGEVYEHGAEVVITSDGLVYNGIYQIRTWSAATDRAQTSWAPVTPKCGSTRQRSEILSRPKSCTTSKPSVSLISWVTRIRGS